MSKSKKKRKHNRKVEEPTPKKTGLMDYEKSRNLCFGLFFAGLIANFVAQGNLVWMFIGTGTMIAGFVQLLFNYRCPQCGKLLLNWTWNIPERCPRCDRRL